MIDAECYHFIRFLKVIRNAEMSAACATTKNIIIVVRKYDENDCRKLLKPFHLAHELWYKGGGGGNEQSGDKLDHPWSCVGKQSRTSNMHI